MRRRATHLGVVLRPGGWRWSVFQERQDELLHRVGRARRFGAFSVLDRLAHWAGRGCSLALVAAAATVGARWMPGASDLHSPTMRRLVVHLLGDPITYEAVGPRALRPGPPDRRGRAARARQGGRS